MRMKLKASSCFFHVWLVVMAEKKKKKGKLTVSGVTLHIGLHFYNNGYYTANSGPQKRCSANISHIFPFLFLWFHS